VFINNIFHEKSIKPTPDPAEMIYLEPVRNNGGFIILDNPCPLDFSNKISYSHGTRKKEQSVSGHCYMFCHIRAGEGQVRPKMTTEISQRQGFISRLAFSATL
jgi:hypothetical protein